MEPVKLRDGIWNLTPGMVASYLIVGSESALLIDTGLGDADLPALIGGITTLPVILATSHYHGDHVGGHRFFGSYHIHPKDLALIDPPLPQKAIPITEGFVFNLGDRKVEVLELPGHTPGSLAFLDRKDKNIFTGDMINSSSIFMVEGQCDFNDFIESMDKISALAGEAERIFCCHGENIMPLAHAAKQKQAAEDFLAGKLKPQKAPAPRTGEMYLAEGGYGFFRPSN